MESKKWYQSLTIWVNVAIPVVLFTVDALTANKILGIEQVALIQSVANILLRVFKTSEPIELSKFEDYR
jgi:hypothetical protein